MKTLRMPNRCDSSDGKNLPKNPKSAGTNRAHRIKIKNLGEIKLNPVIGNFFGLMSKMLLLWNQFKGYTKNNI